VAAVYIIRARFGAATRTETTATNPWPEHPGDDFPAGTEYLVARSETDGYRHASVTRPGYRRRRTNAERYICMYILSDTDRTRSVRPLAARHDPARWLWAEGRGISVNK